MSNKLELYHGSGQIVEFPEIRKTRYTDIVNIGLHFILKNVRPYAAPCSEA